MTSFIMKQLSADIDILFEIIFGSALDEENNKYSDIYNYETISFLNQVERDLSLLEKSGVEINKEVLKSQIITKWFCDSNHCNMRSLDEHLMKTLQVSKVNTLKENSLEITESENNLIKKLLSSASDEVRKILLSLIIKDNKEDQSVNLLLHFKETDLAHYEHLISEFKKEYIDTVNLSYKLFNKQPKDWSTGLSLHEAVCKNYNIKREEFLF